MPFASNDACPGQISFALDTRIVGHATLPAMTDSATSADFKLPGLLAEIAAAAGLDAALAVAQAKGGRNAYFPARPESDHWLSRLVGHDRALAIGAAVAPARSGIEMLVPIGQSFHHAQRQRAVLEMSAAGMSAPAIASELGMHVRTVKKHLATGDARHQ